MESDHNSHSVPLTPTPSPSMEKQFAPFKVPIARRRQTFAVFVMSSTIVLLPVVYFSIWSITSHIKAFVWPFLIYYTIFYYILDKSHLNGNAFFRYSETLKSFSIFTWFSEYFPIESHKSSDLKPTFTKMKIIETRYTLLFGILNYLPNSIIDKLPKSFKKTGKFEVFKDVKTGPTYIFCYHPHGIIACGSLGAILPIDQNKPDSFNNLFPGVKCFILTIINQFYLPFYRDFLMALGVSSVSKKSIKSLLLKFNASVCIVIGGASESLLARPGSNSLILKRRKGFIKIALECAGLNPINKNLDLSSELKSDPAILSTITSNISSTTNKSFDSNDSSRRPSSSSSSFSSSSASAAASTCSSSFSMQDQFQIIEMPRYNSTMNTTTDEVDDEDTILPHLTDSEDCDLYMVPVYGFGENNLFDVYDISSNHKKKQNNSSLSSNSSDGRFARHINNLHNFVRNFQLYIKNKLGFTIPFFFARGVFNYDFGLLPYRRKVDVVFGNPIPIKRLFGNSPGDEVKTEELDYYHSIYVDSLIKLFDDNKEKYLNPQDDHLVIKE